MSPTSSLCLWALNSPTRNLSRLPEINKQKVVQHTAREKKRKEEEEEVHYKKLQEELFGKDARNPKELPALGETDNDSK